MRRPPTWTPERRAALAALLPADSYATAARKLGVARGSVCWAAARYGIGRAPADLSRARADTDEWSAARLTARWADRKR